MEMEGSEVAKSICTRCLHKVTLVGWDNNTATWHHVVNGLDTCPNSPTVSADFESMVIDDKIKEVLEPWLLVAASDANAADYLTALDRHHEQSKREGHEATIAWLTEYTPLKSGQRLVPGELPGSYEVTYEVYAMPDEDDWWLISVPAINMHTQAPARDKVELMARDLIALSLHLEVHDVKVTVHYDDDLEVDDGGH